nr:isocitrate lyase/phosphoenolpyruvate mutase family protein [Bacillus subtilis]
MTGWPLCLRKKPVFLLFICPVCAYTASRGAPDLGIITSAEIAERAKDLVRATDLPLLVDIDTGFGGVLNAARTAREMLEARVVDRSNRRPATSKKMRTFKWQTASSDQGNGAKNKSH